MNFIKKISPRIVAFFIISFLLFTYTSCRVTEEVPEITEEVTTIDEIELTTEETTEEQATTEEEITPEETVKESAKVTRVIDGDTIEVEINGKAYKVRYIGINTPEYNQPFGNEATQANSSFVFGKTVILEKDVSETDKYGRLLRYVYVGNLFINAHLVKLGWAQASTYPPDVKYSDLFVSLEREARENNEGCWAIPKETEEEPPPPTEEETVPPTEEEPPPPTEEEPPPPTEEEPPPPTEEETVPPTEEEPPPPTEEEKKFVGSKKSDVYHYPNCRYVKKILPENIIWFSSVEDARNHGYRPCKVCKPP